MSVRSSLRSFAGTLASSVLAINSDGGNAEMNVDDDDVSSDRTRRKNLEKLRRQREEEHAALIRKLKLILAKPANVHTVAEQTILKQHPCEADDARRRLKLKVARTSRIVEQLDSDVLLEAKCSALAKLLRESKHAVVYVGAGLSTTSNIPDYRSTTYGTYTKVKHTKQIDDHCKISLANAPNFSHMALKAMLDQKIIKYIVSQNCDGLFLRAGIDSDAISEIHGNQFIECCPNCAQLHADEADDKTRNFYRTFDVTQKTAYRRHRTDRNCTYCNMPLVDTIVLSGEVCRTERPACWRRAAEHVARADLILCLGTSLTVIKHYECLWPASPKTQLVIVSLQWTCKDTKANIKINACCSEVLRKTAQLLQLNVGEYKYPESDALLRIAGVTTKNALKGAQPVTVDNNDGSVPHLNIAADYNTLYVPGWLKASVKSSITANARVIAANNSSSKCEKASKKRKRMLRLCRVKKSQAST